MMDLDTILLNLVLADRVGGTDPNVAVEEAKAQIVKANEKTVKEAYRRGYIAGHGTASKTREKRFAKQRFDIKRNLGVE